MTIQERIREIINKIVEWWKSLTIRQRTIIISAGAVVILAFVILITAISRPQYVVIAETESAKETAEIKTLLDGEGITYEISTDGLVVKVLASQQVDARLLLASNNIVASDYTIDNVTSGSFSTTESDKKKKYKYYLQKSLEKDFIAKFNAIETADVQLNIPDDNGTLIAQSQPAWAAIVLGIKDKEAFTAENAQFLARAVATALGNDTTANITIMDTDGNMLFSGADENSIYGGAGSQISVRSQLESYVAQEVKRVLQNTNGFDSIEVASNLDIDFSTQKQTDHNYTPAEGQKQGVLAEQDQIDSSATSRNGGIPGTDSNANEDTYVLDTGGIESSSSSETYSKYLPNESILERNDLPGRVKYSSSTIAVTAIDYVIVKEENAKSQGLLDGITWEQYKSQNSDRVKMEVDADMITTISKATGIPENGISLVAYQQNWFLDSEGLGITGTDVVVIVLIILILGLLAFVILRTMMRERKPKEEEEELSVEQLLQSTPEEQLEAIEAETKSETRKMIEKFVDENPEAAANLLRNWLNEDWG